MKYYIYIGIYWLLTLIIVSVVAFSMPSISHADTLRVICPLQNIDKTIYSEKVYLFKYHGKFSYIYEENNHDKSLLIEPDCIIEILK